MLRTIRLGASKFWCEFDLPYRIYDSVRRRGILHTIRLGAFKFWCEYGLGLDTGRIVRATDVDIVDPEVRAHAREHIPVRYGRIYDALTKVDCHGGGFVDYGSGSGRALLVASTFPFARIIGVEASPSLCALSKANLERYFSHHRVSKAPTWQVVAGDARAFDPPDDTSVFYFWEPFDATIFASVLDRIESSLRQHPRKGTIIFLPHFDDARLAYRALMAVHGWKEQVVGSSYFEIHSLSPTWPTLSQDSRARKR